MKLSLIFAIAAFAVYSYYAVGRFCSFFEEHYKGDLPEEQLKKTLPEEKTLNSGQK